MKKILSLIVLVAVLTSCEEDVKFNNPAVQGLKDNELWKATDFTASRGGDNSLTITADNGFEIITLKTQNIDPGVYTLGINESNKATYTLSVDGIEMFYSTGTNIGDGEITISADPTETNITAGYITGFFHFNAEDEAGDVINFQRGVFYRIPITSVTP
ncbi:membrane lipoprotein lipid attachment site-containing protein [Flavobacterium sp. MFBS3-15]|uniref:membrane lipoprotein lipid attachment site-containing protein n=1 Tax=Flavobacterium sp. MFBS3-15 TaxID=2989816 RepID=UPI002235653F|nr:membrane lipoprotein lipid attachment site-containing protein [Flavobacterium sp. MFBS3-15]MCW4468636.1 membrane lipoprotein lipid attachment site-containing protein [Flavobacterium sp. MFBS3-15]